MHLKYYYKVFIFYSTFIPKQVSMLKVNETIVNSKLYFLFLSES